MCVNCKCVLGTISSTTSTIADATMTTSTIDDAMTTTSTCAPGVSDQVSDCQWLHVDARKARPGTSGTSVAQHRRRNQLENTNPLCRDYPRGATDTHRQAVRIFQRDFRHRPTIVALCNHPCFLCESSNSCRFYQSCTFRPCWHHRGSISADRDAPEA